MNLPYVFFGHPNHFQSLHKVAEEGNLWCLTVCGRMDLPYAHRSTVGGLTTCRKCFGEDAS